jgi:hypothetical protein
VTTNRRTQKLGATLTVVIALLLASATFAGAITQTLPGNAQYRRVVVLMAGPLNWSARQQNGRAFAYASKDGINYFVGSNWVGLEMPDITGLPKGEGGTDMTVMFLVTLDLAGSAASTWVEKHTAQSASRQFGAWGVGTTFKASGRGYFSLALAHS